MIASRRTINEHLPHKLAFVSLLCAAILCAAAAQRARAAEIDDLEPLSTEDLGPEEDAPPLSDLNIAPDHDRVEADNPARESQGASGPGDDAGAAAGDVTYTPTRREFLCLMGNAVFSKDLLDSAGYQVFYVVGPDLNEILCVGRYDPQRVTRHVIQREVKAALRSMQTLAQGKGWSDWLHLSERTLPLETTITAEASGDSSLADYLAGSAGAVGSAELTPKQHLARGQKFEQSGDLDQAMAHFDAAIEADPRNVISYMIRGDAWRNQRQYDKAIADYTRAIKVDPTNTIALNKRAITWSLVGEKDMAIKDFDKAIELGSAAAERNKQFLQKKQAGE